MFYITAETMKEAEAISKQLVEDRLVACVNVFPRIRSFFYWEDKAKSEDEVLMIGKTRTALVEKLIERVNELHSYTVPCVVTWEIDKGDPEFLGWIDEETL
ncbi:divalent-cation tolerance protein CutA [Natranaerofaba carboxydovora]|uniref:divalent-cation tolerance protein CutA n=1 Tax=Natranaerofaba carboxydovora TaxID=2742683 RepID=UPI001F12F6F3|nr:divalent-cation tolerance protein CutA [Natranaerofaba carboxydovora]UMZ72897.1 Divalent-cation tolerance protein CutA [Natranaerofaba carboxydovora]